MDSAFTIADRMAMLDKGRSSTVETRRVVRAAARRAGGRGGGARPEEERLIRQFLRGDAEGPITQYRAETNYEDDLLGSALPPLKHPSVEATKR
jgi:ABC-type transporter Mla maintaining outer membrane lipid asymmetry ATPase subunit MlaF